MEALPKPFPREAGLTLVEVLVVLGIIAVMAGVTVLAIGAGDRGRSTSEEARRLSARLRLAADDVRVDERALAFVWDEKGYGFVDWDPRERRWRPDKVDELARHDLPSGITLSARPGTGTMPIAPDGTGGAIDVRLGRADQIWSVHFDGLNAIASPGTPS